MKRGPLVSVLVVACCLAAVSGGVASGVGPGGTVGADGGTVGTDSGTVGADGGPVETDSQRHGALLQGEEVDQVVMEVSLRPDGSAAWHIEHRIRLDDEAATQGFETTRSRIETDREAFRANFTERVRAMATTAERNTDRVMVIENVSVTAQRKQFPQEYGIVAYGFRWYGFAETGDGLRAGDALRGLFLDEETTLLVSWPDNASLADISPDPDDRRDGAVVWDGPVEFASGEPSVVLESESLSFGPDLVWGVSSNDILVTLGVLAVALLGLVGTGGLVLRRRRSDADSAEPPPDIAETDSPETGASGAGTGAGETETEAGRAESGASGAGSGTGGTATGAGGAGSEASGAGSGPDDAIPEELLSNEERVLALLDERGGRVKQQAVVEALDWSETKTSEVVSDLRETDQIEVYRIGRNNVLALPETGLGYELDDEGGEEW